MKDGMGEAVNNINWPLVCLFLATVDSMKHIWSVHGIQSLATA